MMTGAPNNGVTALRGMIICCGRTLMILHSIAIAAPDIRVAGSNTLWSSELIARRAICGTARPINDTGPQNAVVTAVRIPVDMSTILRILLRFAPRFAA